MVQDTLWWEQDLHQPHWNTHYQPFYGYAHRTLLLTHLIALELLKGNFWAYVTSQKNSMFHGLVL